MAKYKLTKECFHFSLIPIICIHEYLSVFGTFYFGTLVLFICLWDFLPSQTYSCSLHNTDKHVHMIPFYSKVFWTIIVFLYWHSLQIIILVVFTVCLPV